MNARTQFESENFLMSVFGHLVLLAMVVSSLSVVVDRAKNVTPNRVEIIELDLNNPEKVNSIIVKNGVESIEKYGFKFPNIKDVKKHNMFKSNFKLKFEKDKKKDQYQLLCVKIDDKGAEISDSKKLLEELANEFKNQQQQKKTGGKGKNQ